MPPDKVMVLIKSECTHGLLSATSIYKEKIITITSCLSSHTKILSCSILGAPSSEEQAQGNSKMESLSIKFRVFQDF